MKPYLLTVLALVWCISLNAQSKRSFAFDTPAKFTDRDEDFVTYLAKNVKKPTELKDVKAQLVVRIKIDDEGNASVDTISKSVSPEVDAEFRKAILAAPKWIPAKLKGKNVPYIQMAYYNVEVSKATSTMTIDPLNARQPISFEKIYNMVQKNPAFPGGEQGFAEFLKQNIRYPAEAKNNNIMGMVFLQFVIERDGSLTDLKVLRDPGGGLGDEALRVLKKSPKWMPGKIRDTAVRVQYTVPINFNRK